MTIKATFTVTTSVVLGALALVLGAVGMFMSKDTTLCSILIGGGLTLLGVAKVKNGGAA